MKLPLCSTKTDSKVQEWTIFYHVKQMLQECIWTQSHLKFLIGKSHHFEPLQAACFPHGTHFSQSSPGEANAKVPQPWWMQCCPLLFGLCNLNPCCFSAFHQGQCYWNATDVPEPACRPQGRHTRTRLGTAASRANKASATPDTEHVSSTPV